MFGFENLLIGTGRHIQIKFILLQADVIQRRSLFQIFKKKKIIKA